MSITEHIGNPFVSALGWSILHSVWQVLLIGLLWKLALLALKKTSPVVKYRISLLSLFAIPLSFALTFARQYQVYANARQIVSMEFDATAWIAAAGEKAFYIIDRQQSSFLDRMDTLLPFVFWIYIAGIVILTVHTLMSYLKVHRLKTRNVTEPDRQWQERIGRLRESVKCSKNIPVRISSGISVPMLLGLLRPVVLMPSAVFFSMGAEQLEAIILHELYHIKRMDHYVNALQNLLEILFFYHPVTWLINKKIRKLREECVDQWVVERTKRPYEYAQALVKIEQGRKEAALQPALAATDSKNHLLLRIKNLMTMKTRALNSGQKMSAIIAATLALASIAWINPAKTLDISGLNGGGSYTLDISDHYLEQDVASPAEPRDSGSTPRTIHLHDGTSIDYEGLSEKDREEIRKAMEELKVAMQEVNREVFEMLQSEEFRQEIQQAREEARKAGDEARKAMEELQLHLQSEEFRQEMQKAGEEVKRAMEELNNVEWEAIGAEVGRAVKEAMDELNKGLEQIGPSLDKIFRELEKQLKEVEKETGEQEF